MTLIDDIKHNLDLVDIAGDYLELSRTGKNWKARCPFHSDTHPSLVLFPHSQRWKCFGAGCNQSGDLIDLVQRIEKWDFPHTLEILARRAGLDYAAHTPQERSLALHLRQVEDVFAAAMAYFQSHLFRHPPDLQLSPLPAPAPLIAGDGSSTPSSATQPPPNLTPLPALPSPADMSYALSRGWTREALLESGLGSFAQDRDALRQAFLDSGMDPDHPAAVSLLGKRGGIQAWAARFDLQPHPKWLQDDRIPAMPTDVLVYPHLYRGRVVYLSARGISAKSHWNPPRELVGPKQPFYNAFWWSSSTGPALLVEGQGDAISLAHWSIPAVALAGCSISSQPDQSAPLLRHLHDKAASSTLYLALDADQAGQSAYQSVAAVLLQSGLAADRFCLLSWPQGDANDFLLSGADRQTLLDLIQRSPTWLDHLVKQAATTTKDEAKLMAVFNALALMPPQTVILLRDPLSLDLNIRKGDFDELLKIARLKLPRKSEVDPTPQPAASRYLVSGSSIFQRYVNSQGCQVLDQLSNFSARILQEVKCDNGQEVELEFRIGGEHDGQPLPIVRVSAKEFDRMGWVLANWGVDVIVEPGPRCKDHLRTAIQYLSKDVDKHKVFTHIGWRLLDDGQRVYLSASGALGRNGVEVDLDSDLARYRLPQQVEDPQDAMRHSLQFINLASFEITAPLYAAIWLAPLTELVNPAFVLWLYGRTGTLKSTLAALALNHFGPDFNNFHLPANFTDTPYRLEHKAFLVKDALLVVDDYAPQKTPRDAHEYQRTANYLVRSVGNQAGRGRLNREIKARHTFNPRGLVIVTGEDLPATESLLARLFIVELKLDSIDLQRLTAMQAHRHLFPHAMAGYLSWLASHWSAYQTLIPQQWERHRSKASTSGVHLRHPESIASLMIGWEMGLRYALSIEALNSSDYKTLLDLGWLGFLEANRSMLAHAVEEKPEEMFINTLKELLDQGKIYLRQRGGPKLLGGPLERAEMLGWYDDQRIYLLPDASFTRIAKHFRDQGGCFAVRPHTLRKNLKEAGWLIEQSGRLISSERFDGKSSRVIVLDRQVIDA